MLVCYLPILTSGMEEAGFTQDRLGYARARLCSYACGHGAAVRPQTNDAIWHGVIGLWGRVAPLLSPWCARREVPTGVNLNRYSGPSSFIRWHSDNEPLCSAHRMRLGS